MTRREDRLAKNEALAREVNERIQDLSEELRGPGDLDVGGLEILCECGREDCLDKIQVSLQVYEQVRENPIRFIVVPGHEINDIENVVEVSDGYAVVEKHEEEAPIARVTDPRA
jgi:hypothetical protein